MVYLQVILKNVSKPEVIDLAEPEMKIAGHFIIPTNFIKAFKFN